MSLLTNQCYLTYHLFVRGWKYKLLHSSMRAVAMMIVNQCSSYSLTNSNTVLGYKLPYYGKKNYHYYKNMTKMLFRTGEKLTLCIARQSLVQCSHLFNVIN